MTQQRQANHLATETSPYLLQHAHNPVKWYPWGPEALEHARELDRPIFLSIGYSACHWCHVMERESFEDEDTARLLNDNFISIKVDREERPDLDQIYMMAVQLMTGHGGWPMSVFLTPDLRPFYGGTYFPPDDRYGARMPSFKRLLTELARLWREERPRIYEHAGNLTNHLQVAGTIEQGEAALGEDVLRRAAAQLQQRLDPLHGGFGQPPKFLHTMDLRLLLRAWKRFDLPEALHAVRHTLEKMARGGIYDQLGGGFARYSTDARWLVPHFEKMLYDNALLAVAYLEAFQATGDPFFRSVAEESLDWVARDMTSPEGPFYSTLDADSEGHEGRFYVWSEQEIKDILGPEEAALFCTAYGVEPGGNWEGQNILHQDQPLSEIARRFQLEDKLHQRLRAARQRLLEVRNRRVWPGRDEKMLTAWNGLMIGAFAEAAAALDRPDYAERAARAADFLLTRMRAPDGRLFRTYSSGTAPKLNGYLEDYAYLVDALVSLYEATFLPRWLEAALDLAQLMVEQFWDAEGSGFYFTGRDHETLIARTKDPYDNATPAGNAMAVTGLLRLVKLTGRLDLQEKAEATLKLYRGLMASSPGAVAQMLVAYDFALGPVQEFAVVGSPADEETRRVLRAIRSGFRPNKVVALKGPQSQGADELLPLLAGKTAQGGVATYICENFTCQAPLVGAAALEAALS
jgi:uncharacterized protein YyaL (SSP411 family)